EFSGMRCQPLRRALSALTMGEYVSLGNREEVWSSAWNAYYDAYYYEIMISSLGQRWELLDTISKVLIALTASGSAIAGWELWGKDGYKVVWLALAGGASLLSIVHAALQVQQKLEFHTKLASNFTNLRIELETFREQMGIFPEFDVTEFNKEFLKLKAKLKLNTSNYKPDVLATSGLQIKSPPNPRPTPPTRPGAK
ncbi:hypothetical protein, partial [Vibrio cholerae]|uniref:hypothetical protein n=1 Tax=Vibrio cholerae TaxID=666 RepID=UPI000A826AEC